MNRLLLPLLLLLACRKAPAPAPVIVAIEVRPSVVEIPVGGSIQFCAFYRLSDGSKRMTDQAARLPACLELFTRYRAETPA